MEPSLSAEAEPSKVTARGIVPLTGVAFMTAVGAVFSTVASVTMTGVLIELVSPLLSVTVRMVL
jgi:hypothetical protein